MDEKLKQIQKLLDAAEGNLHSARNLFREVVGTSEGKPLDVSGKAKDLNIHEEGKIIEGVYTGEAMVGPDGKEYPVPANYASKSKLVEGDVLKLTIAEDGSFIFKQINPVERTKTIGTLAYDNGNYSVNADGKTYKVLQASVTYYKGEPGDSVTIIIPMEHEAKWAAIENIVKKADGQSPEEANNNTNNSESPAVLPDITENETSEAEAEATTNTELPVEPNIEFPTGNESTPAEISTPEVQDTAANPSQPLDSTVAQTEAVEQKPVANDNPEEGIKELEI